MARLRVPRPPHGRRVARRPNATATATTSQEGVVPHLLALQRLAGNRAVAGLVVQRTLAGELTSLLNGAVVDESGIASRISSASGKDKSDAAIDEALMKLAKEKLGGVKYAAFLRSLHMQATLSEGQLSGVEPTAEPAADKVQAQVNKVFGDFVRREALGEGFLRERLIVLPTETFLEAASAYYGRDKSAFSGTTGFNKYDKVFVDQGKTTDIGTLVHEATHLFASDTFGETLGNDLNEGCTELWARKTIAAMDLTIPRTKYQGEWYFAHGFSEYVGERVLAKAYFTGDLSELRDTFVRKRMQGGEGQAQAEAHWKALTTKLPTTELAKLFAPNKMLAGKHAATATRIQRINELNTEFYQKDLARLKGILRGGQLPTERQSDNLCGPGYPKFQEVFTGKAQPEGEHDLAAILVDIQERQRLVQTIVGELIDLATLDKPEAGKRALAFLTKANGVVAVETLRTEAAQLAGAKEAHKDLLEQRKAERERRKQEFLAKQHK